MHNSIVVHEQVGIIWNMSLPGCIPVFPDVVQQYGLTEELCSKYFLHSSQECESVWSLNEIPTVGFYRGLHNLKKMASATFHY